MHAMAQLLLEDGCYRVYPLISLQNIEGLKHRVNLYLYTNKIARIEGLITIGGTLAQRQQNTCY